MVQRVIINAIGQGKEAEITLVLGVSSSLVGDQEFFHSKLFYIPPIINALRFNPIYLIQLVMLKTMTKVNQYWCFSIFRWLNYLHLKDYYKSLWLQTVTDPYSFFRYRYKYEFLWNIKKIYNYLVRLSAY